LDVAVREAKRKALWGTLKASGGAALAFSFGVLSGLLPAEVIEAAKAFGVLKFGADAVGKASDAIDAAESIRKESLYFLWRIKKTSKQK
jgi:hypothetical protein